MGMCRSSVDCTMGDEVIGVMTLEQCCLGTTNGLAVSEFGGDTCTPCIGM